MKKTNENGNQVGRIVAFLTRDEIDFIDRLAKDALFSTGHKLSRTDIIRALIDAVKVKEINAEGIHSKGELETRLLTLMSMTLPQAFISLKKQKTQEEEGKNDDYR